MAVEDKYVNSQLASNLPDEPAFAGGKMPRLIIATFEVAAADDDGSIYRVAKGISSDLRLIRAEIVNDAITGGTDYEFGVYETLENGGAAIDIDCFLGTTSMASARAVGSAISALSAVDQADFGKKIYENAGQSESSRSKVVDLALTANTVGSAAGTITVLMELL